MVRASSESKRSLARRDRITPSPGCIFDKIKTLVPSNRGEMEITDVNNAYIEEGKMRFSYLDGWWTDAGTFESLLRAGNLVSAMHQGTDVAEALLAHAAK